MDKTTKVIQKFYDEGVQREWERMERNPYEFRINLHFMERYIRPGDRVLDIGGGPGRYSLHLAKMGCDVTLLDLSAENAAFAKQKATEEALPLTAIAGDAREASRLLDGKFDHVLLMGPLYHLLEEADRIKAVEEALALLKPGGMLFAAFISSYANLVYLLREEPSISITQDPTELEWFRTFYADEPYAGAAFTQAYFEKISNVLPFLEQFPLKKRHFLASEGVLAPFRNNLLAQSAEIQEACVALAIRVCEREDLLPYTEHLLYIGEKEGAR